MRKWSQGGTTADHHPAILAAAIRSPQVIADELRFPLAEVEATLAEANTYGTAPFEFNNTYWE